MDFVERAKIGWRIGVQTFLFIFENKKTILFLFIPLVSTLCLLLFFAMGALVYHDGGYSFGKYVISVLVFYVLLMFFLVKLITIISEVALSFYVGNLFEGRRKGFFESMFHALSRLGTLIAWLCCTLILSIISSYIRNKKSLLLSFFDFLLQLSWSVATFFVIPFFAFEDDGIIDSIKKSSALVVKTFGDHIEYYIGFGFISMIAMMITAVFSSVFLFIFIIATGATITTFFDVGILFTLTFFMIGSYCIASTAHIIFKTAVYNFSTGRATGSFEKSIIISSFVSEKV